MVRITVQSEGRRLDVTVPTHVPLVEVMPGFVRGLGQLDPSLTTSGFNLQRPDGTRLDPQHTAADEGVHDGDVLTLTRGTFVAAPRVYDDIVEAVIDATAERRPWTAQDGTRTALAMSLSFLSVCAILLFAAGRGQTLSIVIAGIGTVLLLAAAAVIARLGQSEAGSGLGIAAAVFGALTAYLAVPEALPFWGWPVAAAAAAAILVGGAAVAVSPHRPAVQYVPVITGAAVAVPAVIIGLNPFGGLGAYTIMLAVSATLANALPWLALSTTSLRVISAQSDAEIFSDPTPIATAEVMRRAAEGHRVLTAMRCALGIAMLAVTPVVASINGAGLLVCALAFTGLMFPARMSFARVHVMVLMVIGGVGLVLTAVFGALNQPDLRPAILIVLALVAAVTITVTLLSPRARLRLARVADSVEVFVLALLLPLGLISANLI